MAYKDSRLGGLFKGPSDFHEKGLGEMRFWSRRMALGTLAAISVLAASSDAHAQLNAQTRSASPARVEDQIPSGAVFEPRVMPRVEVREGAIADAPAGSENIKLTLQRLNIEGATVYSEEEMGRIFQDKIGQTITLADVYGIAGELTRKYRNDGYILTQVVVPPQTIERGSIKLVVVEGYINNVEVRGEGNYINDAVALSEDYASLVRGGATAVNVRQLERTLLMINDIPGVQARGILSPSETTPGAADLLIVVQRDIFEGQVSLDNHGSRFLGPVQFGASAVLQGLFGWNERFTGQAVYAPDDDFKDELTYLGLGFDMPVGTYGTMLNIAGNYTNTEPGFTLEQFDVDGDSRFLSVGLSHPFVRTRNFNVTGRLSLDWRNVDTDNNIEADRKDHVRAVRAGGRVEFIDTLLSVAYNIFDVELSHGLNIMNATSDSDTRVSRPGADWDFFKMEAEYQRLQRVTNSVNVLFGLKGQISDEALWSSEEFGLGGLSYARGFDPSEVTGDDGIAGKIEVQWNQPVKIGVLQNYQLFSFYDAGVVWDKDATTLKLKREELTSAGFGVRADFTSATQAGMFVAFPLNRDIATQRDDDPRVYMNVSHKF